MADYTAALLAAIAASLEQNMRQIERCAALLGDERAWHRSNEHCNSVANLLLHLNGNVSQWILVGVGQGDPVQRDRPAEFAARGPGPVAPLSAALRETIDRAREIILRQDASELSTELEIQGYRVTSAAAIYHVGEHFSFHAGQIVHITKTLLNVDLSLYDAQGRLLRAEGSAPW